MLFVRRGCNGKDHTAPIIGTLPCRRPLGLKPTDTKETKISFAVCIANTGYEDLEVCKVYRVLADATAVEVGCLRVIGESGEDYLYPADRFMVLDLPEAERECLLAVLEANAA